MEEFNFLADIAEALDTSMDKGLLEGAQAVKAAMKAQIQANGQVDTGNLEASIYVKTDDYSDYPGDASEDLLPEVEAPGEHTAVVTSAADYAIYQDYGTRFQPARPFMEPAMDASEQQVLNILSDLEGLIQGEL